MRIDPGSVYKKYQNTQKIQSEGTSKEGRTELAEGQTVKGKIIDANQTSIKVKMSNGEIIEARTTQQNGFSIGEEVTFVVKDVSTEQILLTPIMDENGQVIDKLAMILKEANMPVTEANTAIVEGLIKNNMSINQNSLKEMALLTKQYPDTPLKHLLFMTKHHIPISSENLSQLAALENNEHTLMKGIASLADDLTIAMSQEQEGQLDQGVKLLEIVSNDEKLMAFQKDINLLKNQLQIDFIDENEIATKSTVEENTQIDLETIKLSEVLRYKDLQVLVKSLETQITINTETDKGVIPEKESMSEPLISTESLDLKTFQLLYKEGMITKEQLRDFLTTIQDKSMYLSLTKGLLLSENQLSSKEAVKAYFSALHKKVNDLIQADEYLLGQHQTKAVDEATRIKSSVEFLNALNQDFNLLHLPLLFDDQLLNTELYIMNNKKTSKDDQESITALVRLDLLNLGHTDIYIKKIDKNVEVAFYMEDETQIDVVREQVFKLHKMLTHKGFNILSVTVQPVQKEFNLTEDFFGGEDKKADVKRYTFDMRA